MDEQHHNLVQSNRQGIQVSVSDKLLWSLKEAAAMCGISEAHYRKLRNAGILPGPMRGTNRISAHAVKLAASECPDALINPKLAYDTWKKDQR